MCCVNIQEKNGMDDERGGVLVVIALCHLQFVLHFEHFGPALYRYLPASTRTPAEGAEAKSVPEV